MTFFNIFSKNQSNNEKQEPKTTMIVDHREKNSLVPSELVKLNFNIEFQQLKVGDYLLNDIAIERKTINDLKSSIINKRIFQQLAEIKQYPKHFLIIEGNYEKLYNNEILKANAMKGFILSLALQYQIPVIYSENEKDSAVYISLLANKKEKLISLNPKKLSLNKEEQIQYILEGFPDIGPATANKLIEKFKSIKNIINADEEELKPILGKRTNNFLSLLN